jgi:two-component system, LytTR family, response regulator
MKCIIVDDEPLAREILESYVEKVPFLKLIASCKNAFEALDKIQQEKPDLIFLDIQMPDLNGIQFYESLVYKPLVIFTTAYSDYAVSGFDLDATDYLVKPFSFDRFMKAVNKARVNQKKEVSEDSGNFRRKFMFVKDGVKIVRVPYDDILYFEGMKDYVKIVMKEKFILTLISMQHMADKLPGDLFVRVHRSYIVSISKIEKVEKNRVVIADKWIPVGNSYKDLLSDALGQIN